MNRSMAVLLAAVLVSTTVLAKDSSKKDERQIARRGDVRQLPDPLIARLVELAGRPHTFLPLTIFSEAPTPSQLFMYALLDTTGFPPNQFTSIIPGVNDGAAPTAANCANHGLPTIGSVRIALEPKPGLPTDPNDAGSFIDIFTDVSGLFVINNESGWYEGWMIHDVIVPDMAPPREDGHAQFGAMTTNDAIAIAAIGAGNNVPGNILTTDGNASPTPANRVKIFLSMGAWNSLQQSDAHSYWEFNPYTDWVFPLYELPSVTNGTGCVSLVPGSGPSGINNDPAIYGDTPESPRDPDRLLDTSLDDPDCPSAPDDDHKEKRLRFIPSGLANEIFLDVFARPVSFEPGVTDVTQRLYDAYAAEVARVDSNGDGVLDAVEADIEDESDGGQSNDRLFIPATQFNRFVITREINDGLLAPRFGFSQKAWVLSGNLVSVNPAVPASIPQDADNR
jgi:hypothetical protein